MDKTFDNIFLLVKEAGREIQSLSLDPASFSLAKAIVWVMTNGFKGEHNGQEPEVSDSGQVVFTQRDSADFVPGSLVVVELRPGVMATVGTLKAQADLAIGGGVFDPEDQKTWVAEVVAALKSAHPPSHSNPSESPRSAMDKDINDMTETENVEAPAEPTPVVTRDEFDTLKTQVDGLDGKMTDGFSKTFDAITQLTDSLKAEAPTPEPEAVPEPEPETTNDEMEAKVAELEAKIKALSAPAKEAVAPTPAPPESPLGSTMTWRSMKTVPILGDESGNPKKRLDGYDTAANIFKDLRGGN